ncbi:MAG: PadR family transcriptional regulator [Saccharofermentans sp.]|nr:PadR family transcriptional regulator [Saccharofermentans sp.]
MNSQYKKGVLDMCVLAILEKGDSYGYDVADALSESIELADGTVYPILRKLAADGSVTTYLQESQNGPPRKYYHLTPIGKNRLEADKKDWKGFSGAVDKIIGEEGHYEQTRISEET